MHVTLTPTTEAHYTIGDGIYLWVADQTGGKAQIAFHPKHHSDALDRLDSLIEVAIQLRDAYRLQVEGEAAEMAAEEEAVRLQDDQIERLEAIAAA